MAEFKIGLGIELENNAREELQGIINSIKANNPPIPIKVDTSKNYKFY